MQTSYSSVPAELLPGMEVDSSPLTDRISRVVETSGGIPAGVAVIQGTASNQCIVPAATGDVTGGKLLGVTRLDTTKEPGVYAQYQEVTIKRKGRIGVKVEQNVTFGDPAFVRFATGAGGSQKGGFRKDADTASAVALPGARFLSTTSANGTAVLELNL